MPDPLHLLTEDHREVEQLFETYRQSQDPSVVQEICTELAIHAAVEEKVIYPLLSSDVDGGGPMRTHAEEEHERVKEAIFEIERLGYADPGIDRHMETIIQDVTDHVHEEEGQVFPKMRDAIAPDRLAQAAKDLSQTKRQLMGEAETAGALFDFTTEKLYDLAKDRGIEGRSNMTKDELISALRS